MSDVQFIACAARRHGTAAFLCMSTNRETGTLFCKGRRIVWVQDVYPDEHVTHVASLRKQG
jgi:hypothetical protein